VFWDVRKGLIPIVGAAREPGTTMLLEDVACPVDKLADMMIDLVDMFQRYGYHDASCFGHALEGNLHLVFSQGFRNKDEVQRFKDVMEVRLRCCAFVGFAGLLFCAVFCVL
jgi:D-lactate dehydrogenase